jgi:hypothetical protein
MKQLYVSTGKPRTARDTWIGSGYAAAPRVTCSPSSAVLTDLGTRDLRDRARNALGPVVTTRVAMLKRTSISVLQSHWLRLFEIVASGPCDNADQVSMQPHRMRASGLG